MPEIEAAMRKGEYSCWIYETNISSATIAYLKELGYKITSQHSITKQNTRLRGRRMKI